MTFLVVFFFYAIITVYASSFYFSSREVYDFILTCFNLNFWVIFLFYANSLFTIIFFVEVLSTLVLLLLLTSSFSTTYFYSNLNLSIHAYFSLTTPLSYLQALIFFFWISLLSSLSLFFFLIMFYLKFLTHDWFLFDFVFYHITVVGNLRDFFLILFLWFNLLFCFFLKCGLVPFYFWKPAFFKGISIHALSFYILFFYFFIFLFFIYFFLNYMHSIFYFCIYINVFLLLAGFLVLLTILCEAFYIKVFLALSSIINTLFVIFALNGLNNVDSLFCLL